MYTNILLKVKTFIFDNVEKYKSEESKTDKGVERGEQNVGWSSTLLFPVRVFLRVKVKIKLDWVSGLTVIELEGLELNDAISFVKKVLEIPEDKSQNKEIEMLVERKIPREGKGFKGFKKKNKEKEVLREALELFRDNIKETKVNGVMSVWRYASKSKLLVKEFSKQPAEIIWQLVKDTRYNEACLFGTEAFELLKDTLGPDHPDTLIIQHIWQ
ncbi:hypothetical protein TNIN_161391 [Trichonephila inaurata madagascariensis]|uniref:Uncharacterized protein n=1 Tax=Trichonephila inaurata madagascariensis TaxID=2747483 RepID=A0A8X7C9Z0_9ARAC|nr:hypothetical protein TNIN_161391 [Trichonephila inaurata madagascariensis]